MARLDITGMEGRERGNPCFAKYAKHRVPTSRKWPNDGRTMSSSGPILTATVCYARLRVAPDEG
jgi:hypothetical protein